VYHEEERRLPPKPVRGAKEPADSALAEIETVARRCRGPIHFGPKLGLQWNAIFASERGVNEVTPIGNRSQQGDAKAAEDLLPLVYEELRRLAAHQMARETPGQTLQPTALVHEAWLRLAGSDRQQWTSRGHFLGAAAEAMRRILIDKARRKNRVRHGKGFARVDLNELDLAVSASDEMLLRVDEALEKLAAEDKTKAELVKLRYFAGLSIPDAAQALGLSETTAKRQWAYTRAWLYDELTRGE
jgi:RNA polymerase sigma factor (TIGR02999 family)